MRAVGPVTENVRAAVLNVAAADACDGERGARAGDGWAWTYPAVVLARGDPRVKGAERPFPNGRLGQGPFEKKNFESRRVGVEDG